MESIKEEIWKDIEGYEKKYQVSNLGRVKSMDYRRTGKEKVLKTLCSEKGYVLVGLYRNGKQKFYRIHRLVALAFIHNPDDLPEVNHKDEDKTNNCIDNLEWCDREYNLNYGTRLKRIGETAIKNESRRYGKHGMAKSVICITTGDLYDCISFAADQYEISHVEISRCCKGEIKYAGIHQITGEKLVWMYLDKWLNDYNDERDMFINPFWCKNREITNIINDEEYKTFVL